MHRIKRAEIFFVFLLFTLKTFGNPAASAETISRAEAIRYAVENSENAQLARERANQLRAAGKQTSAFAKPQADIIGNYLELKTNAPEIPIRELAFPERDISSQVELRQLLYSGGRIWRSLELEKNIYRQAKQAERFGLREVVLGVKLAFDTVLFQKTRVDVLQDRTLQRQTELEDASDLHEVGMVTSLDVRQAKLRLNFAKDALEAGKADYLESLIDFNVVLGKSAESERLIPQGRLEDIPEIFPVIRKLHRVFSEGEVIDIEMQKTEAEAARLNYRIRRGEYFPEIQFVSTAGTQGESTNELDESWSIGLQFFWKIFDGGLIRSKVDEAAAELRSASENLERTRNEVSGQVEKITVDFQALQHRAELQNEAVILSRENYEDARGQYRAGTITLTRLGEFNLSYAEARFRLIEVYFLQRQLLARAEALLEQ
mgnify:CR=1 FL=1